MKQSRLVVISVVLSLALVFGVAFAGTIAGPVTSADKDAKTFVIKVGEEEKTVTAADDKVFRIAGKAGREVECEITEVEKEKEGKKEKVMEATKCKVTKAAPGC